MLCQRCGKELPAQVAVCGVCGWPVSPAPAAPPSADQVYNTIADKVGFVPNVRRSDNLLQAKIIGGVVAVGAVIGLVWGGIAGHRNPEFGLGMGLGVGTGLGVVAGLVVGLLVSGLVLAIVGLKRKE